MEAATGTESPFSQLPEGHTVGGRFQVQSVLASDGLGYVYAALDTKTQRAVSLRHVPESVLGTAGISALRTQVKELSALKQRNLVPVFGVSNAPGGPLIVQGSINGHDLASFVDARAKGKRPLALRGAYNVVAHLCHALTAAHAQGAAHGLVRPCSVWIGSNGTVQLADLALARTLASIQGLTRLPEDEVGFLAPEVKEGKTPEPGADLFGLGALLYVMLTGRSPTDEFIHPSQAHKEADAALDKQLLTALSADPTQRPASPEAFRTALLPLMEDKVEASASDFGVDIDIEVSLASVAPSMAPSAPPGAGAGVHVPKAPKLPTVPGTPPPPSADDGAPQAGARVSIHEDFRVSMVDDEGEREAAEQRQSLGEVNLEDVLAKITENDSARWVVAKNGMDHGPFSGRQLVNMILQGEALADHELMNLDTGERRKVKEFADFTDFLKQYEIRKKEQETQEAIASTEVAEQRSNVVKIAIGVAAVVLLGLIGGIYALTRSEADTGNQADAQLDDLYERGELDITGSAGILPMPKRGKWKGRSGGGGAGGMSYEQAMMQAVDLGSAANGGGEQQLSRRTIQGVMDRNLGRIGGCVGGGVGKVTIDMAILGSGKVAGVSVRGGNSGVQSCVAKRVRGIRFPSFSAPRMGARYSFQ